MGNADDVKICHRRQRAAAIDRFVHGWIVIARQYDNRQRGGGHHARGAFDQILRHAVAVKRIAGKNHDVGRHAARRIQHASEARNAVAAVEPRRIIVIDVQVRTVHHDDVADVLRR